MPLSLLGLDIGGSGVKAGLFAVGTARLLRSGYVECPMTSDLPGHAEHDPETWWEAAIAATRQAIEGADPATICGVGISCTNGLVAVDARGRPLRSAIMLWDQRAQAEVEHIGRTIDPESMFQITGNPLAPGAYSLPTILWLQHHDPKTFRAAHKLLVPGGYLVARLTGEFTIDHSRACTTLLFDIRRRQWHEPFLQALDLPADKLPRALPGHAVAGTITAEAASLTGLRRGTPVIAGCMDTLAASIGSGVMEPGDCFVIMGTAARVCTALREPRFDRRFMNCAHTADDRWLSIGALNGIGSSWRWIRDTFGQPEQAIAQVSGQDPYDLLTAEAAKAPPGSRGLIFLPYIAGERTPIWNPRARSVFLGITLGHTRSDFLRSVLEGAALAIRHVVEILEGEHGLSIPELRIGGGAARSAVWNQIIADTLGKVVVSLADTQTEVLGAALLAGVGLRIYPDCTAAIAAHVRPAQLFVPDERAHAVYNHLFPIYRDLYPDVEPYFTRLSEINLPNAWASRGDSDERGRDPATAGGLRAAGVHPATGPRFRG
jgi:xylulokinase